MLNALDFVVPPGIGDISWIYSKLVGLGRALHITVPHSNHDRAVPYLDLLSWVASAHYAHVANPAKMDKGIVGPEWTVERLVQEAERESVPIELNRWLEAGNRIEDFMPGLPTVHHYSLDIRPRDIRQAEKALGSWRRFICLYCANRDTVRRWGGWSPGDWAVLAGLLCRYFDIAGVVLIGAGWDREFADSVIKRLRCPYLDLVDKLPIGATLHVVRKGSYLVAFPSGIPILSVVMDKPTMMFYPEHLEAMQNAWAPKDMIGSGAYKGLQFCPPVEALHWIRDVYELGEKLDG